MACLGGPAHHNPGLGSPVVNPPSWTRAQLLVCRLEEGFQRLFVPCADAPEASLIGGLEVIPVQSLSQLVGHLNGSEEIAAYEADPEALAAKTPEYPIDFSDVRGQEHVKRAMEVAAAGGHNLFCVINAISGYLSWCNSNWGLGPTLGESRRARSGSSLTY